MSRSKLSQADIQYFVSRLKKIGIKGSVIPGILSSLGGESHKRLDPTAKNSIGAIGIAQWLGPRKKKLIADAKAAGKEWTDPRIQIDHVINELTGPEKGALNRLKKASTAEEGNSIWTARFERPHKVGSTAMTREIAARAKNIEHFKSVVGAKDPGADSAIDAGASGDIMTLLGAGTNGNATGNPLEGLDQTGGVDTGDSASVDTPGAFGVGLLGSISELLSGIGSGSKGSGKPYGFDEFFGDFKSQIPGVPSGGLGG